MLDKYKGTGKFKPYLIFGLTDETFSILVATDPPEGISKNWFMFWTTFLNQCYWVTGSHGIPEIIATVFIVVVHRIKKNVLLSIAGGTLLYMALVQYIFI